MDLYEIFIIHNRAWTPREIAAFAVLFLILACCLLMLARRGRIVRSQVFAALVLLAFLGIVFASTVFTRMPVLYKRYELSLFWSWKRVLEGSRELLKEKNNTREKTAESMEKLGNEVRI